MSRLSTSIALSYAEQMHLLQYNRCCADIQGSFERGVAGLIKIRTGALARYIRSGYSVSMLVQALKVLKPHWRIDGQDEQSALSIFYRLLGEQIDNQEIFITMSVDRFVRELRGNADE